MLVIKDSMPMVLFIIIYMLYFSWIGQCLFAGSIEGTSNFGSFGNSFFNMLVCMTTSNFPDVMLPAYAMSRYYAIYFVIYLVVGLFLMMNLLLAIFYSNFKNRFEANLDDTY
jgi:two pore calcium channel protein